LSKEVAFHPEEIISASLFYVQVGGSLSLFPEETLPEEGSM
jgi:hypothetical protein